MRDPSHTKGLERLITGVHQRGKNPKMPDFKVSTRVFSVERGHMERYGDTDDYHYGLRETVNGDDEEDLLSVGG